MVMSPRRIRQLPPAAPAKDTDVFPVSQMDESGSATTRAMTRQQFQQDIIDVIAAARQQFVDASNAEHARLHEQLDDIEVRVAQNEISGQQMQAALVMIEQMVNGESGKTPYDLWLEAGNSGSLQDYLNTLVGPPGTTRWEGITNKPTAFPAAPHAHPIADVEGLSAALASKADAPVNWGSVVAKPDVFPPAGHGHSVGEIVGLQTALDGKAAAPVAWADVSGKPSNFQPSTHTHPWSDITGKPANYPPSSHTHLVSEISGLQAVIDKLPVILGEVDVVDTAVVALSLGVRFKDVAVPASWGMRTSDTLFITAATALPAGYAVDNAIPLTTTSIRVYFVGPALALLASNTLRVRVAAIART